MAMPQVADAETLVVSRTTYELLQFEVHYLRALLTPLVAEDMLRGRHAKLRQQQYAAAMARATIDPEYRHRATG